MALAEINLDRVGGTKVSSPLPVTISGGGGGGGAATIADGADVTQGALADAAVTSDSNGTLSGKLRGLVKILADIWDAVNHRIKVDGSGVTQPVSGTFWQATQPVSGSVSVSNLPATQPVSGTFWQATQPVSASSLPLPSGASTEATLALIKAKTDNLDVLLSSRTKPADTQPVSGTFWQATQPVSAASLPLPTGASTEATLALIKAKTDNLDVLLSTRTKPADTQPVSGTFWQATQPVSAASLPLPSGAATSAKQDTGNTSLASIDTKIPANPAQEHTTAASPSSVRLTDGAAFYKPTTPSDTQPVSGTFFQATQPVSIASMPSTPVTGTFFQATQPISAATLPLPTGAAQDSSLATLHTDLTTLDSDLALAQGALLTTQKGPMMQAVVSDAPQSYVDNYIQPLSITREGRLRVSAVPGDVTEVWNATFTDPFLDMSNLWTDAGWGTGSF